MKIALCISGIPRFLNDGHAQIMKILEKALADGYTIDVFIHMWTLNDPDVEERVVALWRPTLIETSCIHAPTADYNQYKCLYGHRMVFNMHSMFESIQRANALKQQYEQDHGLYDFVIRARFDSELRLEPIVFDMLSRNHIHLKHENPYTKSFSDQFAVGSSELIDTYSMCYPEIPVIYERLISRNIHFFPEEVLMEHLRQCGIFDMIQIHEDWKIKPIR